MPRAVVWYAVYCFLNAALHIAASAALVWFCINWRGVVPDATEYEDVAWAIVLLSVTMASVALLFGAVYLGLPRFKGKHAWEVHMANIALGAGAIVLTPIALPLLVAWFGPDVKAYYGAESVELVVS